MSRYLIPALAPAGPHARLCGVEQCQAPLYPTASEQTCPYPSSGLCRAATTTTTTIRPEPHGAGRRGVLGIVGRPYRVLLAPRVTTATGYFAACCTTAELLDAGMERQRNQSRQSRQSRQSKQSRQRRQRKQRKQTGRCLRMAADVAVVLVFVSTLPLSKDIGRWLQRPWHVGGVGCGLASVE